MPLGSADGNAGVPRRGAHLIAEEQVMPVINATSSAARDKATKADPIAAEEAPGHKRQGSARA